MYVSPDLSFGMGSPRDSDSSHFNWFHLAEQAAQSVIQCSRCYMMAHSSCLMSPPPDSANNWMCPACDEEMAEYKQAKALYISELWQRWILLTENIFTLILFSYFFATESGTTERAGMRMPKTGSIESWKVSGH